MSFPLDLVATTFAHDFTTTCIAGVVAGLVSLVATPWARRAAHRWGIVDEPGPRRVHHRTTARLGGPAVLLGILTGSWAGLCFGVPHPQALDQAWGRVLPILSIAILVCGLGAWDDVTAIRPRTKLFGLIAAGALLPATGIAIDTVRVPLYGDLELGWASVPATILWVVACTNAINLIDGVDGAGTGVSMIAALTLAMFALGCGALAPTVLLIATSGAACGFLFHNRQPATIFLGDSGSLLLGFMLAACSASSATKGAAGLLLVGTLVTLAVPFLDAGQSFIRRFRQCRRGERPLPISQALRATAIADKNHIHHRLLVRGLSHAQVARVLCAVTGVIGVSILLFVPGSAVPGSLALVPAIAGLLSLIRLATTRPEDAPELVRERAEVAVEIPRPAPTAVDAPGKAPADDPADDPAEAGAQLRKPSQLATR